MSASHRFVLATVVATISMLLFCGPGPALADDDSDEEMDESDDGEWDEDDDADDDVLDDADDDGEDAMDSDEADDEDDDGDEVDDAGGGPSASDGKHVEYPSPWGYSGLIHTMSARTGENLSWSLGMHVSFFSKKEWLYTGDVKDHHKNVAATAHVRFSPIKYLELFVAVSARSNSTNLSIQQPSLFQTIGDASFGVKGLYTFADTYTIALAVMPRLVNNVGDTGLNAEATSVSLMLANTIDLQAKTDFPLQIHVNLGWDFNNTAKLVDEIETQMSVDPANPTYIMRFERYALGVSRNDHFLTGLAFEFRTPWVQPFVEWTMGIPVNRQDFLCGQFMVAAFPDDDSCLANEGMAGFPMDLTLGFRFQPPPLPELSVVVAADIGLTGTKTFVRETVPNEPYLIWIGLSYSFVKRTEIVEIERVIEKEIIKEIEVIEGPRIMGKVTDSISGDPVEGAVVTILDESGDPVDELSKLVTEDDGTFISQRLEEGTFNLGIEAEWYEDSDGCSVDLGQTGDEDVSCEITPLPRPATIQGKVIDGGSGDAVAGVVVSVEGKDSKTATTDSLGLFQVEVEAGEYAITGKLEGWFDKQVAFTANAGETQSLDLPMNKVPKNKLVVVKKKQIVIKKQIQFEFDSATIKPESFIILDWVAQVLKDNPEIELVEIQGHTDDQGAGDYNLDLSQKRADAVRDYLIDAGIDADRLIAKGYGEANPIVPNVTGKNRAQNRRVEFHIIKKAEE
jgi:outer membrane protein OmpA-like peptidoglycan-associated protein